MEEGVGGKRALPLPPPRPHLPWCDPSLRRGQRPAGRAAPLRTRHGGVGARRRRARPGGAAPQAEERGRSQPATPGATRVVTCFLFPLAPGGGWAAGVFPSAAGAGSARWGQGAPTRDWGPPELGSGAKAGGASQPHPGPGPSERVGLGYLALLSVQGAWKEILPEMRRRVGEPRRVGAQGQGRGPTPSPPARSPN